MISSDKNKEPNHIEPSPVIMPGGEDSKGKAAVSEAEETGEPQQKRIYKIR